MILEPLTIPGRSEMLSQLMDYVVWAATAVGLGEQGIYRLSLAVDEIATNIVTHGYAEAERQGDLRQVPQPDNLDRPLEELQDGGLGIFLALWGVDDFAYDRQGEVNRITFVMNLGE